MADKQAFVQQFREVQVKFSRLYTRILGKMDLTLPQYALLNLVALSGRMPMSEASRKLHISKPAVTKLVDRLERTQLLKRNPHAKDRRIYLLQIQPKGHKVVQAIRAAIIDEVLLKALEPFESADKQTLHRFFGSLSERMNVVLEDSKGGTKK